MRYYFSLVLLIIPILFGCSDMQLELDSPEVLLESASKSIDIRNNEILSIDNSSLRNRITQGGGSILFENENILAGRLNELLLMQGLFGRIEYNVNSGFYQIFEHGKNEWTFNAVQSAVTVSGTAVVSSGLSRGDNAISFAEHNDKFGTGVKITVTNSRVSDSLAIIQNFYIYTNRQYLLLDVEAQRPSGVSTNNIAVMRTGAESGSTTSVVVPPTGSDRRFLAVPYDNDEWVRFNTRSLLGADSESYEVAAVFENQSRNGFVLGSVSHDTWKTGVRLHRTASAITGLFLFNGITSFHTRDTPNNPPGIGTTQSNRRERVGEIFTTTGTRAHGSVSGVSVNSSLMFFGFFNDWRNGMEEFGQACGIVHPPLNWSKGAPWGWNSWSAAGSSVNYNVFTNAADFFKEFLPYFHNGQNPNFINFDSFWDNLTEQQRIQAARQIRNNDQIAGIYHTPFTSWHGTVNDLRGYRPDGVPEYTWHDLVLKDGSGNPIRFMNNKGWALDPTHPGTVAHNAYRMRQFQCWGFDFVKLDFISHGALEGQFYHPDITTGIQAYNYGMKKLNEAIGPALRREEFFISLSISPIFPAQYAHSRRISCDVFGQIDASYGSIEMMLNSLTYGWWMHKYVYPFNDPDHITVYRAYNSSRVHDYNEALSAFIAAAITGGLMINSDLFTPGVQVERYTSDNASVQAAMQRVIQIMDNPRINAVAASERTFRPLEGNTGHQAADIFVRDDRAIDGSFYIAIFNFSRTATKNVPAISLSRLGLDANASYTVFNVINGQSMGTVTGQLPARTLERAEPLLFQLRSPVQY